MTSKQSLHAKFRGCLAGGLIGDCMGSRFDWRSVNLKDLINFFNKELKETNKKLKKISYTDDTAMTKSVAESLIQMKGFDAKDMAKRFTLEYFENPQRAYGGHIVDVFEELKQTKYKNPFEPARKQFQGKGSLANGAAMRTGPVPLFSYRLTDEEMVELAINCAKITHTHREGYNGAVLQCFAIREALRTKPSPIDHSFDVNLYLSSLIEKFQKFEAKNFDKEINDSNNESMKTPFTDKLVKIQKIFEDESKGIEYTSGKLLSILGNGVFAIQSVPTAIYSVLKAQQSIDFFPTNNPFVRTIFLAISLGGDTDTIGSMAGSIAGALYGYDLIPDNLQNRCEDTQQMIKYSEDLFDFIK